MQTKYLIQERLAKMANNTVKAREAAQSLRFSALGNEPADIPRSPSVPPSPTSFQGQSNR